MEILKNAYAAAVKFHEEMNAAINSYHSEKEKAKKTFNEQLAEKEIKFTMAKFEKQEAILKNSAIAAVNEDVEVALDAVNAIVTAAAPSDFFTVLEAVKAKGAMISDYECRAVLRKYKNNYIAVSTLCDMLHSIGKMKGFYLSKPDAIEIKIKEFQLDVVNWILSYKGDSLYSSLMLDANNGIITNIGKIVQDFIDGPFFVDEDAI